MRRLSLAVFCLILCARPGWSKWDPVDKAYLVEQFRALQEEIKALKAQLDNANSQIADLRQTQQQLQAALTKQQRTLQDMDQLVSSLRLSQEENASGLKTSLAKLSDEQKKAFASLMGKTEAAAAGSGGLAAAGGRVVTGYVTGAEGENVSVDIGSGQGLQPGSHLAVFKASDSATRVGVLEVQQVVDAGNSRARILTMNPGVRPEFGDIVRLE
jgi:alanyl-tRNA synthetase